MDLPTQFEELMQRSPIPQHDMKTFLREMRRTPAGTIAVSKLLAAKIQSNSEAQAIHAFEFLETALESEFEGSIEFRTEIGRYRFLNEIIRILSPKYLADTTPEPVKERATKFLEDAAGVKRKRWFPSEHSKVNSVYQSLVDGGILQKPHRVADEDAEFQKSIFERGENALILKRLLQSKDPSDLQAANRLIKNLVDEEARRNERRAELHSLIDRIETSTGLLTEMLSQPNIDKEIVDELVDTCRTLRQKLGGIATETNDEATSLLQASENIEHVLVLYESKKDKIGKPTEPETNPPAAAQAESKVGITQLSLADELLMNLGDEQMKTVIQQSNSQQQSKPMTAYASGGDSLLLNLDVDLAASTPIKKSPSEEDQSKSSSSVPVELFGEISKISREMMEQGLKGVPNSSQLKKTDKTPLSQIKRSSPSQELPVQSQLPSCASTSAPQFPAVSSENSLIDSMSLLDLDFLDKPSTSVTATGTSTPSPNNLSMDKAASGLSSPKDENLLLDLENEKSAPVETNNKHINNNGVKSNGESDSLSSNQKQNMKSNKTVITNGIGGSNNNSRSPPETGFCLNVVRELDLENIDLLDDIKPMELSLEEESCKDVSLTLTFGKYPDFPSSVSVAVITLTNKSKHTGLLNYVFQLLPPKGLQVKLLPPACMELPPWKKTFLPPPILTQVALIVISKTHPSIMTETQPKIKYILSYCVEEETILHNGDFSLPTHLFQ